MKQKNVLDASSFSDSLAQQTAWDPLSKTGAANRGHWPVLVNSGRLEFRPTLATKLTYLVFFSLGGGLAVAALIMPTLNATAFALLFVGLCIGCASLLMLHRTATPIVFDKRSGLFWKGRQASEKGPPHKTGNPDHPLPHAKLDDIHALQIIAKYSSENSFSYSYLTQELNLVLKDGKRMHVVDATSLDQIRKDARTLSLFLEKPLWDGTTVSDAG
jgi:hypothetical protein